MFDGLISNKAGRNAATLAVAWLALTSPASAREGIPSALEFMVEALQSLCLTDGDRIETARRLVPAAWQLRDTEDHIDVQLGDERIFPRHDAHQRGWRGALADGQGSLSVSVTEYRDLARPHDFSASFSVSPETAVDLDVFQRRIGMRLRPDGPAVEGTDPSRSGQGPGEDVIVTGWQPSERQFGRFQAYRLEPSPSGVELRATRYWGAGYPDQILRIGCSMERAE